MKTVIIITAFVVLFFVLTRSKISKAFNVGNITTQIGDIISQNAVNPDFDCSLHLCVHTPNDGGEIPVSCCDCMKTGGTCEVYI